MVSTSQLAAQLAAKPLLETRMLPDNFDPVFTAWGIKRRDFTQPQPAKVTR